ncbi:MAG: uncharacterized protein QG623_384 [Patescibacteria group bacterium]|nr:uncharacterized protein [Patescibacteria group bacterium]
MTRFEFYKDTSGSWRWRVKSLANGRILGDSSEGYANYSDCVNGARLVKSAILEV